MAYLWIWVTFGDLNNILWVFPLVFIDQTLPDLAVGARYGISQVLCKDYLT